MSDNMFEPEFTKQLFTVEIHVYNNCITTKIIPIEQKDLTYHLVVGAVYSALQDFMFTQSGINVKKYQEWLKSQEQNHQP